MNDPQPEGHMASYIRRRKFLATLFGGAAAWPLAARAQQSERMRRVGVLMNGAATETIPQSYVAAFVQELRQLGWTEGRNLRIDVRWNAGDAALARIYAAQLIGLTPDVILTASTTNLTVIQQATNTVPVVFVQVSDPVEQGFVASITKPGGNLTGFSMYEFSVGGKWVDLLKEIAPSLSRVAVMFNPDTSPQSKFFMRSIEAAAPSHGVQAIAIPVRTTPEIEAALQNFSREPNGGLIDRHLHPLALEAHYGAGGTTSPAIDFELRWFHEGRRSDLLRRYDQPARTIPAGGELRRSHPQG
jgi:putative tryptophan/tyrosine transport system substrate-binding protein